jgi:hypothetical protein
MASCRRAVGRIAITWLLCQATTLTLVPAVFWSVFAEDHLLECTCTHGDHAICPMHHKPTPGSKRCALASLDDSQTAAVGSLLVGVGPVPTAARIVAPVSEYRFRLIELTTVSLVPTPPDSPPPRA